MPHQPAAPVVPGEGDGGRGRILLELVWPGDPVPKGRPRHGRNGHSFTPARTRTAEATLRSAVDAIAPPEPWPGPVGLAVVFYCRTRRRTDGDNLAKLVVDAVQRGRRESGGIILDDAQIVRWEIDVHRAVPGQEPRTEITMWRA
jgi:crossover junction endodeoxyribonuclease RusA